MMYVPCMHPTTPLSITPTHYDVRYFFLHQKITFFHTTAKCHPKDPSILQTPRVQPSYHSTPPSDDCVDFPPSRCRRHLRRRPPPPQREGVGHPVAQRQRGSLSLNIGGIFKRDEWHQRSGQTHAAAAIFALADHLPRIPLQIEAPTRGHLSGGSVGDVRRGLCLRQATDEYWCLLRIELRDNDDDDGRGV